jgi:hypothetical protein
MWHKGQDQPSQSWADRPYLLGQPTRCWRHYEFRFGNVSMKVGARDI